MAQPRESPAAALARLRQRPARPYEASTFFFDPTFLCASVKVLPGEYFVHDEDIAITTTLGSCVAACLHDADAGVGGMNHFMLPDVGDPAEGGRYGDFAMTLLIDELLRRGARRGSLVAKVFGGGRVMKSLVGTLIGEKNVAFVQSDLARRGIPLLALDVLDICPRKVCLFPRSGRVLCRRLPPADEAVLRDIENRHRAPPRPSGEETLA